MTMLPIVTKLENNLTVVSAEVPGVNSVGISIWVKVGSRHEEEKKIGLAHFLEHMAFKGTKSRSALDIAMTFDCLGGNFNAFTDKEHTVYHVKVMKKDIAVAMEVLTDIILHSSFPDEEISREKDVVLQEIYQTNDSVSSIIFDKYMEVAYADQVFGRPILGSESTVQNFTRDDLVAHMERHYFGSNMVLSVAGDVPHDEIVRMAGGFLQIKDKEKFQTQKPKYTGGLYVEQRDLEQINIVLGFPGVSYNDAMHYPLQILDSILGNGLSSRLFQEVREKLGLVYSIYSFNSSYSDSGLFSIHAATDSEKLPTLLKTITSEIRKLPTTLTESELKRVKSKLESEILMSRESTVAKSEALGYYYSHHGRYIDKEELIDKISAVSMQDVVKAGNFLLENRDRVTAAAIGNVDSFVSQEQISDMLAP